MCTKEGTFKKLTKAKVIQTPPSQPVLVGNPELEKRLEMIREETRAELDNVTINMTEEFEKTNANMQKMFEIMIDKIESRRESQSERTQSETERGTNIRRGRRAMTPGTLERELEKREREFLRDPSFNISATFMPKKYSESTRVRSQRRTQRVETQEQPVNEDGKVETVEEPNATAPRRGGRSDYSNSSEDDGYFRPNQQLMGYSNPRARRTLNRSTPEAASLNARSLLDIHKKAIDLSPWLGPRKDHRTPLQFISEFESQIVEKLGGCEKTAGEIFYNLVMKSLYCSTWFHILRRGMPYSQMKGIFLTEEWGYACKELYFDIFKKTNRDNSLHSNFVHYFNYWADRLEESHYGQDYIVQKFRNNLPDRFQSDIDLTRVRTIRDFGRAISRIPYRDLDWSPLHKEMTVEKREEILAEMGVKGFEKKKIQKESTNEKKFNKEEKGSYYKKFTPKNVNQIVTVEEKEEEPTEN